MICNAAFWNLSIICPFGYHAEYFYYLMVYSFEDGMLEEFFPRRIAKPALAIRAERGKRSEEKGRA